MKRYAWRDRIESMDPERDFHDIYRIMVAHEFPWDMNQSLSFALFRTYAVPGIGALLASTGEFTERTQKRYDDTGLILDAVLEHGFSSDSGRRAIRRMNRMHRAYSIPDEEMRYVLCTFVVTPMRWMDAYGWRSFTETERIASANYYRELGRHMNIRDIPATYREFCEVMDAYEAEHFRHDPGARAVADSTLELMTTFPPNNRAPAGLMRRFARALMDDALLEAFDYPRPSRAMRALSRTALRLRGRFVRFLPPRTSPKYARQSANIRSYPDGYDLDRLGTFPPGCPVPELGPQPTAQDTARPHSNAPGSPR
ncbi:uncharacterized protein DUF2236 [Halopolyspora algeriensis]|uniref:Uncharacterized protein DUF2236 n=1 Tax=Halopolyspora algeriensis TaxID=1500506 RepID=A0A368VJ08_9ACTN|nr:oxygenase MpaB family protein [Halopolyspora algeriensis]RCW40715.1 uncharacterized protein DUF2236 [Halopolyspora algeriensis]TQM53362.1 uncharacterized protein DUF2236 [Halopolyspora algeriensis]